MQRAHLPPKDYPIVNHPNPLFYLPPHPLPQASKFLGFTRPPEGQTTPTAPPPEDWPPIYRVLFSVLPTWTPSTH
ncbi:hypothetical protein ASPBRDRAFT_39005 [Aspergillus brasiliensis CBS 101740]|uniref:Uncharacterized protein n=1 Tax=Aspergillus brasiliensis (strain CBS 101740 / IMI 381727 / IBT 21946) TaxID=767769 RepID=A0A1L9UXZ6_ASPBC|nr:hypothetical protein ASPBRDRAFT_39005 [Aspergillus brasiliensis CBS 101740]